MSKKIAFFTLAVFFLCIPIYVLGAPNTKPIDIYINGSKVDSDVQPIISDGRTLVPLRVISENLGADVHWDNNKRSVRVTTPSKSVILKINDKKVTINDKKLTLDVPAKIVNDRTMVPLRFIGESLGAQVHWNNIDRRVNITRLGAKIVNMSYEKTKDTPRVVIKGDGPLEYTIGPETEPNKLAIDIKAQLETPNNALYVDDDYLSKVIIGEITNEPPTSRVVLDLQDELSYTVYQSEDKQSVIIAFANTLKDIDFDDHSKDFGINLEMSKSAKYNYFFLADPDRLVLDIEDAILSTKMPSLSENEYVSDIRLAQFSTNPNTIRVVFDLKKDVTYKVSDSGNNISVNFSEASTVDDISLYSDAEKTVLEVEANGYISYEIKTDKKNKQIKIVIPGVDIDKSLLKREIIDAKDGIVDFVEISKAKGYLEITANLYSFTGYNIETPPPSSTIKLVIYKSPLQNKLIVVDPGHGGSDPGATVEGLKEKDLNLDISMKLKQLLEEGGARVFMTRESDIYVDYFVTPGIANEIGADLFVSVHNNTATNSGVSGTETLYFPGPEKQALAQAIQDAVVRSLGLTDRGIKERPGLVVTRETKMPSALVEVAFMTNSNDRVLLMTDEFKQKAAEGIYEGILNYLSGQN